MEERTLGPLGWTRALKLFSARKTWVNAPRSGASANAICSEDNSGGTWTISPSEVAPLATEYVENGLNGEGEMEDSVTDWVINMRIIGGEEEEDVRERGGRADG